ncbi:MAG: hypothetical protein IT537_08670 [Hyphomicrobiales bacterium]|nr:hypothetical protein [Hyphomicrobiales bacterium]
MERGLAAGKERGLEGAEDWPRLGAYMRSVQQRLKRHSRFIDLTGRQFGSLLVETRGPDDKWGHVTWVCHCSCGKRIVAVSSNLRKGDWRSCGCKRRQFRKLSATKYGGRFSPEYRIWQGMLARCLNKKRDNYPRYGVRGIGDESRFGVLSTGEKLAVSLVLDRKDLLAEVNGGYSMLESVERLGVEWFRAARAVQRAGES